MGVSEMGWGQTTVSYSFSAGGAVTGLNVASPGVALDANIGFGSFRNNSGTNPGIFSGQLRLYQNATKGGSIKIYASNGVTITKVVVNASSSGDGAGPAGYSVDNTTEVGTFSGGGTMTMNVSATSYVEFYNKGTSSSTRTYVNSFEVTYTSGGLTPPTLAADASLNNVDNNIDITFIDDASWRTAVTAVKIGGTALSVTTDYELTAGNLKLKPSGGNTLLTTAGSKSVTVEATGYSAAAVTQQIDAGAATKLAFTTAPSSTACPNTNLSTPPAVTAQDQYNNTAATFTGEVSLTNSGSIGMTGNQVNAGTGVATFTNLQFTAIGNVTLTANATGLTSSSPTVSISISVGNATSPAASNGNTQSVLTWTNPASCSDEIMIIAKAGSAVTASPSGDGTAYTANLAFGSGTPYDGGFVVYKGSTSSQTITGLTNGTTYYFTFFTRKGTSWSSGTTTTSTPALSSSTTDHFRTRATGNWNSTSTWESSADGTTNWINATLTPTSAANTITILNGHTVTVTASVTVDQVVIASGGILIYSAGDLTVNNGVGNDIVIEDGGIFRHSPGSALLPTFSTGATFQIKGGGILEATTSNGPAANYANNNGPIGFQQSMIWDTDGIFYWNNSSAFSASGLTYFPQVTSAIPIFRISSFVGTPGGGSATIINGKIEVNSAFTWNGAGTKTFRNGIIGTATMSQGTTGQWIISGSTADIGGSGTLSLGSNGLTINTGCVVSLISDKQINGGSVTVNGTLSCEDKILSGTTAFTLSSTGTLKTANATGINGSIAVSGTKTFNSGANYYFNGTADQTTGTFLTAAKNIDLQNIAGKVTLSGNIAVSGTLTIPTGNKLDAASFVISGTGDIDLQSGGTFITSHPSGLNGNNTTTGGLSSYSDAANYTFNGTSAQVTGSFLPVIVNNLTLSNSAGVTLTNNNLTVNGTLSNTAGNEGFIIESGKSLIHNSNAVPATLVRTIPGASNNWHLLSSPVNTQSISTGNFADAGGYDFYMWQESGKLWVNYKNQSTGNGTGPFFDLVNGSNNFTSGHGYLVAYVEPNVNAKTFTGALNNGNIPFTVKYSGSGSYSGSNLMGNPYPSGIDWNLANRDLFEDDFAYAYNALKDGGEGYEEIDGGSENAFIGANQGFFVIAKNTSNNSTFNFTNSMRGHGGTFFKNTESLSQIKVRIANSSNFDETSIRIKPQSSINRDRSDALKMRSYNPAIPQIFSYSNDLSEVAINTLPAIEEESSYQLGIYIPSEGSYTISIPAIEGSFTGRTIYLLDNLTGAKTILSSGQVYSFTAAPGDDASRFSLHFASVGLGETPSTQSVLAYYHDGALYVNNTEAGAEIMLFGISGQLLKQQTATAGLNTLQAGKLSAGVYVVRVQSAAGTYSSKVIVTR